MEALKLIKTFPKTKEQRIIFAQDIINYVLDGNIDPLDAEIALKSLGDMIEFIRKDIRYKECVTDEADLHPEKIFDYHGAVITKCHRPIYDFSKDSRHKELKGLIKEREQFLKIIPETGFADPVSGEITYRPPKKITEYLKIEYK